MVGRQKRFIRTGLSTEDINLVERQIETIVQSTADGFPVRFSSFLGGQVRVDQTSRDFIPRTHTNPTRLEI